MKVAFGADDDNECVRAVVEHLRTVADLEICTETPWHEFAREVGRRVADGEVDFGVVMCWTGTGVSIAANKVDGVRAALCTDAETARGARRWNDANVLALGLRLTSPTVAREMVEAFLDTDPDPGEAQTIARVG
jgi:ribose 5-phosphate isomerase B